MSVELVIILAAAAALVAVYWLMGRYLTCMVNNLERRIAYQDRLRARLLRRDEDVVYAWWRAQARPERSGTATRPHLTVHTRVDLKGQHTA